MNKQNLKNMENKLFWSAITASFAFTVIMFNITMDSVDANAQYQNDAIKTNTDSIKIVNGDIKQILIDTSYLRGTVDQNGSFGNSNIGN